MKPITVIDSVMGAGKTTYAIEMINKAPETTRFIYITPFLSEIERVISATTNRDFMQPTTNVTGGSKLTSLKRLVENGEDIAATHALFEMADDELRDLLRENNYTLILDEVMNVVDTTDVSADDMRILIERRLVEIVNNRVTWIAPHYEYERGVFDNIRLLAEAGTLYYHRDKFLIYAFPPSIFDVFTEAYVLTYLFDAQLMRYYFDLFDIPYVKQAVKDGQIVEYDVRQEKREELFALIELYEGTHNKHGEAPTAFSKSWLQRKSDAEIDDIKASMYSFTRRIANAKANEVLWTTVKDFRIPLKGKGYAKGFLACNARATNEYADRTTVLYMYNRYMNPRERAFFQDHHVTVNEDMLALSDLLQWLWRSQIRDGKRINAYIPASRMRKLLREWSEYRI